MSHIAILHPQCVRVGGAIQMALQTAQALQKQGHTVTLYTFEKSEACFPDLQEGITIKKWGKKTTRKLFKIITLAFHLRHVDIIIANNPPMQIVAALAKAASLKRRKNNEERIKKDYKNGNIFRTLFSLFSSLFSLQSSVTTVWWHHHVPWYYVSKNKAERIKNKGGFFIYLKGLFERFFIIPFIDEMIVTSHFVADCVQKYCGREATVIHPVIQVQNREYPRSTTTPLKGGLEQKLMQEPELETSPPFKGVAGNAGGMATDTASGRIVAETVPLQKSGYQEYAHPANTKLQSFSHQMSRQMTRAEQRLWFEVLQSEKTGHKWVKQKIIGNFIVDFYCHEKRLVIEVDGGVHQDQQYYDLERTKYLENLGIRVIRYTNEIVLNQIDQVRERVQWELEHEKETDAYPRSTTTPLKGGLEQKLMQEPELETSPPFKGGENQYKIGGMVGGTAPVTLFTHGRLEPGKGIDMLVRVFHVLQDIHSQGIPPVDQHPEPGISPVYDHGTELRGIPPVYDQHAEPGIPPVYDHPLERGTGTGTDTDTDTDTEKVTSPPFKLQIRLGGGVAGSAGGMATDTASGRIVAETAINLIIFGTGSLETELRESGIEVRPFDGETTFMELSTGQYGHVLGVYCSEIDAFGMASLESQMAGLSTVILDRGGASEAILSDDHDEPVGYLVHTEEELSGTISRYVHKKVLEKQMSNVNFSHKRDYFLPERLSSDLLSVITKTSL